MSDAFPSVGRNEPCPCGSGKKYKKCHYQEDVIKRQTAQSPSNLGEFLPSNAPAYLWYKGLRMIVNRRDWNLLYESFIEESAIRAQFASAEDFVAKVRTSPSHAPMGGDDYTLRRFRFLGDHVFILGVRGEEDRSADAVEYELLACRGTGDGLRIYDMNRVSISKMDDAADTDPDMESFPAVSAALSEALAQPLVRPYVRRWPIPGAAEVSSSVASAAPNLGAISRGDVSEG